MKEACRPKAFSRHLACCSSLVCIAELFANFVDGEDSPALGLNGATFQFLGSRIFSGALWKLYPKLHFVTVLRWEANDFNVILSSLSNDLQVPCVWIMPVRYLDNRIFFFLLALYVWSVGARFSTPVQAGRGAHPASCTMGTGPFPEVKSGRGVTMTPHHLLVPWSRKSRAIPLLPLWAVRSVHSLSACTITHFTFTFFVCLVKWTNYWMNISLCIHPEGWHAWIDPGGVPFISSRFIHFLGNTINGGTNCPVGLIELTTVTREPLSAEWTEDIWRLPFNPNVMPPEIVLQPNCTFLAKKLQFKRLRLLTSVPKSLISMLLPARFWPNLDYESDKLLCHTTK